RRAAADTGSTMGKDGGEDISEMVEEEVCMMMEYWRTLVMSCSWGILILGVQDRPDCPALLVTPNCHDTFLRHLEMRREC
ncbi:MAG: hypothetical protein DRO73_09465, partial [Candidatus Thorarchaeota archaeon]